MKQILIRKGLAQVTDVPSPNLEDGELLVRVKESCLSIGTELSHLDSTAKPLWRKALDKPDKALKAMKMLVDQGPKKTWYMIEEAQKMAHTTGYSIAGVVKAVAENVKDISPGDHVACAGAQYAHHAEIIRVPRNLCAIIPDGLDFESASTVTLGAIALQGVRRAQPTLGETFVVIGLGVIGQLTAQLLRVNGCRVIGLDTNIHRIEKAKEMGMEYGFHPDEIDNQAIYRLTGGNGADGVIITAATPSDTVVETAFNVSRIKGRVILVGDVGLKLNRADFYKKELDFLISTSYGPGRYDPLYEDEGIDYPIGYVRWTENRNMQEYLKLLSEGKVRVNPLITNNYSIDNASDAYADISGENKPLLVTITYPDSSDEKITESRRLAINFPTKKLKNKDLINIAIIGAGSFAKTIHLPNIRELNQFFRIRAIVNRTGPSAKAVGDQFGADYVSTDPTEVFTDPDIDAVLIATRHNLHGSLALEALNAGKHVLVEKPLTLDKDDLKKFDEFYSDSNETGIDLKHDDTQTNLSGKPLLMTGYNRRFSPFVDRMKNLAEQRLSPFIFNYRMNAGYIPLDHWVHGDEGGGRNLGEACHIYDLFTYLTDSKVVTYSAHSIKPSLSHYSSAGHYGRNDNFVAAFSFEDGSVANLIYTALGNNEAKKEYAELYVDGKIAVLDDYQELNVHGMKNLSLRKVRQDKGLLAELEQFSKGIQTGVWPIPFWQQIQSSEMSFGVESLIFDRVLDVRHNP